METLIFIGFSGKPFTDFSNYSINGDKPLGINDPSTLFN